MGEGALSIFLLAASSSQISANADLLKNINESHSESEKVELEKLELERKQRLAEAKAKLVNKVKSRTNQTTDAEGRARYLEELARRAATPKPAPAVIPKPASPKAAAVVDAPKKPDPSTKAKTETLPPIEKAPFYEYLTKFLDSKSPTEPIKLSDDEALELNAQMKINGHPEPKKPQSTYVAPEVFPDPSIKLGKVTVGNPNGNSPVKTIYDSSLGDIPTIMLDPKADRPANLEERVGYRISNPRIMHLVNEVEEQIANYRARRNNEGAKAWNHKEALKKSPMIRPLFTGSKSTLPLTNFSASFRNFFPHDKNSLQVTTLASLRDPKTNKVLRDAKTGKIRSAFKEVSFDLSTPFCQQAQNIFVSNEGKQATSRHQVYTDRVQKNMMIKASIALAEIQKNSPQDLLPAMMTVDACVNSAESRKWWEGKTKNEPGKWISPWNDVGVGQAKWMQKNGGNLSPTVQDFNKWPGRPYDVSLSIPKSTTTTKTLKDAVEDPTSAFQHFFVPNKIYSALACQTVNWNLQENGKQCVSLFNACYNNFGSLQAVSSRFTECMAESMYEIEGKPRIDIGKILALEHGHYLDKKASAPEGIVYQNESVGAPANHVDPTQSKLQWLKNRTEAQNLQQKKQP